MAVNTAGRPELPDLVIHEILRHLPTKAAVRASFLSKQWEGMLSSAPSLDFDEGGCENDANKHEQHHKFISILKRCLLVRKKEKENQVLDKLRLRMKNYLRRDALTVTEWLSYSFERSVRELDISLSVSKSQQVRGRLQESSYYCLSLRDFVSAKSITSLNLEYVILKDVPSNLETSHTPLLPSLKKISFKTVRFDPDALSDLLEECPAVEYLSLISCSFIDSEIYVPSSSLKYLEIKHCKAIVATVQNAANLESVIVVSPNSPLEALFIVECPSLKYVNVYSLRLSAFELIGCHDVKGIINTPNLHRFSYEGYLKSKFTLKAPHLATARITFRDIWGEDASSFDQQPGELFIKVTDFLKEFGGARVMILLVHNFKVLVYPKDLRRTTLSTSSILHNVRVLEFGTVVVPANEREMEDLMQFLQWMAPSATDISQLEYNEEQDVYVGKFPSYA